ncbi:MAG: GGDEF domain-containing protein [Sporolactobacillus sp.]
MSTSFLIYYTQNTVVGLALLFLIAVNRAKSTEKRPEQRVFSAALIVNALLLLLELLLNLVNGAAFPYARQAMQAIVFLFYCLNPFPELLWVLYLACIINKDRPISRRLLGVLIVPAGINAVLAALSVSWGFTFTIDSAAIYHRGPFYMVMPLLCYSYLLYYLFLILQKRKRILTNEFRTLMLSVVPPIIAGIVQTIFFGISVVWLSMVFSLLIIYMRMQSVQIQNDYLTGLTSKRHFDQRLRALARDSRNQSFGAILIDVDQFKVVNDTWGHGLGDLVLEKVGMILRHSVRKGDVVARIGGDEFAVLVATERAEELRAVEEKIAANLAAFNRKSPFPFQLSFSSGSALYDQHAMPNLAAFVHEVDQRMYDDKKRKR